MVSKQNVVAPERTPCSTPRCSGRAAGLGKREEPLCVRCSSEKQAADTGSALRDLGSDPQLVARHGGSK